MRFFLLVMQDILWMLVNLLLLLLLRLLLLGPISLGCAGVVQTGEYAECAVSGAGGKEAATWAEGQPGHRERVRLQGYNTAVKTKS